MVGFDTDTILLVLQTEREIWKAVESIEIDDDDENIAMNTALNILLHNAIEEFGRAPVTCTTVSSTCLRREINMTHMYAGSLMPNYPTSSRCLLRRMDSMNSRIMWLP